MIDLHLPGLVPVPVPGNCQTACDDRLKAGPLREERPAPGFRRGRDIDNEFLEKAGIQHNPNHISHISRTSWQRENN